MQDLRLDKQCVCYLLVNSILLFHKSVSDRVWVSYFVICIHAGCNRNKQTLGEYLSENSGRSDERGAQSCNSHVVIEK